MNSTEQSTVIQIAETSWEERIAQLADLLGVPEHTRELQEIPNSDTISLSAAAFGSENTDLERAAEILTTAFRDYDDPETFLDGVIYIISQSEEPGAE